MAPDPTEAARYYGQALRRPSPILGNASLRLGRLYRDGRGVEQNESLAYQLFRQAVAEDTGPNAQVALAEMLVELETVDAEQLQELLITRDAKVADYV